MKLQEDYCSFETAKLLKEKGFDFENQSEGIKKLLSLEYNEVYFTITHALAMKWLREVHKISIEIYCIPSYTKGLVVWRYMIRNCETCDEVDYPNGYPAQECLIFEEAVEAALKYSLENLI